MRQDLKAEGESMLWISGGREATGRPEQLKALDPMVVTWMDATVRWIEEKDLRVNGNGLVLI